MIKHKTWLTAREIAWLKLPEMPGTTSEVMRLARERGWLKKGSGKCKYVPSRRFMPSGRRELAFDIFYFPYAAKEALANRFADVVVSAIHPDPALTTWPGDWLDYQPAWTWFGALPLTKRRQAITRAVALADFHAYCGATIWGAPAARLAADLHGVHERTIGRWRSLVDGVPSEHWLPYLAGWSRGR